MIERVGILFSLFQLILKNNLGVRRILHCGKNARFYLVRDFGQKFHE